MFAQKVCHGDSWGPFDVDFFDSVLWPPLLATVAFAPLPFDNAVNKAFGSDIVGLNPSWKLWMFEFLEAVPHWHQLVGIHMKGVFSTSAALSITSLIIVHKT